MDDEDDEDEEEGKLPAYPRGMLRLDIACAGWTARAMEYKRIDGLGLGVTPLGLKVRLL